MQSLIEIGKLTEPATKLVEKIADAFGAISEPWQIKRVARARAEARIIDANADIRVQQLQKRAVHRRIAQETREQLNIEQIAGKTIPLLTEKARPDRLSDDWLANFFKHGCQISDDDMQKIWAQILAGECESVGSFSKFTVEIVSKMDKSDAELFSFLTSKIIQFEGEEVVLLRFEGVSNNLIFKTPSKLNPISNRNLRHLAHLGLYDEERKVSVFDLYEPEIGYAGKMFKFSPAQYANRQAPIVLVLGELSFAGAQLSKLKGVRCTSSSFEEYIYENTGISRKGRRKKN